MARRSHQPVKKSQAAAAGSSEQRADREQPSVASLSAGLRLLISVVIAYHLVAVFIGAWMGSPPTSPLADEVSRPFRHYIAATDLNHGYRFFAPNPGPSHLFRYRLTFADGSTQEGHFPDRHRHWPRLLYHRYFMLSENLNAVLPSPPPGENRTAPPESRMVGFRALARSYAAQVLRTTGAERIDWELVRHYPPSPDDVLEGRSLLEKDFYAPIGSGTVSRKELP